MYVNLNPTQNWLLIEVGVSYSRREQKIGKTVKTFLLRVPLFDEL